MDKISNFILSNKHNQALPGEKHQVIYMNDNTYNPARFSGPGTRLDIRVPRNEQGLSYVDNVAKRHDLEYLFAKTEDDVKRADEHMIMKLDEARAKKLDYPININQAELIRGKYYANRLGVPTSFFTSFGKDSIADQSIIPEAERQLQELIQQGYGKHRPRRLYKFKQGKKTRYYYKSNSNDSPMYIKSHGSGNNIDRSTFVINLNNPKPVRRREPKKPSEKPNVPIPVGGGGINQQATKREVTNAYSEGYNVGLSKEDRRAIQAELDKASELKVALQDKTITEAERQDLSDQLQIQLQQIQEMRDSNAAAAGYIDDAMSTAPPSEGDIQTATTIPDVRLLRVGDTISTQSQEPTQSQGTQAVPDTSTQGTQTERTDIPQPPLPAEIDNLNPLDNTPDPTTGTVLEEKLGRSIEVRENPLQADELLRQQIIQDFTESYDPTPEELDSVITPKTSKGVQQAIQLVIENRAINIGETKDEGFQQETKEPELTLNTLTVNQLYKIADSRGLFETRTGKRKNKNYVLYEDPDWERTEPNRQKVADAKRIIKKLLSQDIVNIQRDWPAPNLKQSINDMIQSYKQQVGFGTVDRDGISTEEVESIMRKYNHVSIPVIPSDMIHTIRAGPLTKEIYFVMNLDPHDKPGSHWVAIAISNLDKSIMYYDSLCIHPTHQILQDLKRLAIKMDREHMFKFKFNTVRDQSKSSGRCGFFAIQFIHKIMNGKSFKEASMYNRHYKQGEHEIQKVMHGFGYI